VPATQLVSLFSDNNIRATLWVDHRRSSWTTLQDGFPYVGMDKTRLPNKRVSGRAAMQLMRPHLNKGRNVTN